MLGVFVLSFSDRPLSRSLIRLAFLLVGKKWRHGQAWWPGLSLDLPGADGAIGAIRYRDRVVGGLHPLSAILPPPGREIFIVASGPSINNCDLSNLPDGGVILVNGAIHFIGGVVRRPLAVVIEDERFVWRHIGLMREKIGRHAVCLFSVGVIRALCEIDPGWLAGRTIMLIDDVLKPYGAPRRRFEDLTGMGWITSDPQTGAAISLDPARGFVQAGSVAVSALQFALFARPSLIGIFGVDLKNAGQPRFYETKGAVAKSGIVKAQARVAAHFALARRIGEDRGTRFECYSPVSTLLDYGFEYSDRFST